MNVFIKKRGQGAPVVLFHGWGFNHSIWENLAQDNQKNYSFYLVDLPGFGNTKLIDWQKFKLELLRVLPNRFILGGWSLGGLFATKLAIEAPHRVSYLFNIASSPCFIEKENWPGIDPIILNNFYNNLKSNPKRTFKEFLEFQKVNLSDIQEPTFSLGGLKEGLNILKNWDLRDDLFNLTVPVSYVYGRLDKIVNFKTFEVLQQKFPHFNYYPFKKAAHMPFLSHPTEFIKILNRG